MIDLETYYRFIANAFQLAIISVGMHTLQCVLENVSIENQMQIFYNARVTR